MKKRIRIHIVKLLVLLLPIVLMTVSAQNLLFYHSDHNADRLRGFYREEKNSLDVVIVGASEVYTGFAPVYAYDYSGLTSYAYAYASNPGSLYLNELKEILSRQNPQLILVETQGFLYDDNRQMQEPHLRTFSENIPMSLNKLEAIWKYPYEDKLSCLFPFFKYHGDWQLSADELGKRYLNGISRDRRMSRLKGILTVTGFDMDFSEQYDTAGDRTTFPLESLGEKYLLDFLAYCQEQKLENVVFVRFPHKVVQERQYEFFGRGNQTEQIIRQHGFTYLDFEQMAEDLGFDPQYDYYDAEHLNIYGQMKLTEAICDILLEEYGIQPREQSAENRARWDAAIPYTDAFYELAQEMLDQDERAELYETPDLLKQMEERMSL